MKENEINEITVPAGAPVRTIEVITSELRFYKAQAGACLLEVGKRLIEAKAQLSHGDWLPWLRSQAEFSERTAQNLMKIAREYTNPNLVADLGVSKAVLMLALEEGEREEFASVPHPTESGEEKMVKDMSSEELKAALQELEETRQQAKETEEQLSLQLEAIKQERDRDKKEQEDQIAELRQAADQAQKRADRQEARAAELEQELARAREEAAEPGEDQMAQLRKEAAEEAAQKLERKLQKARKEAEKAEKSRKKAEEELKKAKEQAEARIREAEESARQQKQELQEMQAEKDELKQSLEKAEKQLAASGDQERMAFKIHFNTAKTEINAMIDTLDKMKAEGKDGRDKLKKAVVALLECTLQNLREKSDG